MINLLVIAVRPSLQVSLLLFRIYEVQVAIFFVLQVVVVANKVLDILLRRARIIVVVRVVVLLVAFIANLHSAHVKRVQVWLGLMRWRSIFLLHVVQLANEIIIPLLLISPRINTERLPQPKRSILIVFR
jgi:hypothetical protein